MKQDKLIAEAAEAKAAGLSYGKWKALHPKTEPEPEYNPEDWSVCLVCGKTFKKRCKQHKKYCDETCYIKATTRKNYLNKRGRDRDKNRTEETAAQL